MMLCQRLDALQVLQLALAAMYVLVGVSAVTGWLPAGCFGALCLAFPVVRNNYYTLYVLQEESCRSM